MTQLIYDYPATPRGDTVDALEITLDDGEGGAVDLTDADIRVQFRECSPTGCAVKTLDLESGIIINDAVNGVFTVSEFVADFPKDGTYYFDTQVVLSDGYVDTPVFGTLVLTADVTR